MQSFNFSELHGVIDIHIINDMHIDITTILYTHKEAELRATQCYHPVHSLAHPLCAVLCQQCDECKGMPLD